MLECLQICLTAPPDLHPGSERARLSLPHSLRWLNRFALAPNVPPPIRGAPTAIEALLRVVASNAPFTRQQFIVPPKALSQTNRWLSDLRRQGSLISGTDLVTTEDALLHVSVSDASMWFEPAGATGYALRLRQAVARNRCPPLVSVQHSLSTSISMRDIFSVLNTAPTFPYDVLVCPSHASAAALNNLLRFSGEQVGLGSGYQGRVTVIPLPVDTDYFCPGDKLRARRTLNLPKDEFVILYLGYCSLSKSDLLPLISAIHLLQQRKPAKRLRLVVAGTSDTRHLADLRQEAARQGVAFTSKQELTKAEVRELYQASDLFVSLSDTMTESFGLTPVEAMACGLPQIVSGWNGYSETVAHEITGFLLPTTWRHSSSMASLNDDLLGDEYAVIRTAQAISVELEDLVERMHTFLTNEAFRVEASQASRKRAITVYSEAAIASQYKSLWKELACIEAATSYPKAGSTFGSIDYHRCFAHYAGTVTTADTVLGIGPLGKDKSGIEHQMSSFKRFGFLLDWKQMVEMTEIVGAKQPVKQSQLWQECLPNNAGINNVKFDLSICWLLKHGFLREMRPLNKRSL